MHYVDEPPTFRPLEIFKYRKRFFSPLVSPLFLLLFLCPLFFFFFFFYNFFTFNPLCHFLLEVVARSFGLKRPLYIALERPAAINEINRWFVLFSSFLSLFRLQLCESILKKKVSSFFSRNL